MDWYIGTIGYSYREWRGVFFPAEVPARGYLGYYSRVFNAVELDTTFYGVPRLTVVQKWSAVVPDHFRFCLKTPKIITHQLGLRNADAIMQEFVGVVTELRDRLGVILIQLPPSFKFDMVERLSAFLSGLPKGVRYAVELRSPSWYQHETETAQILREKGVCWAAIDLPGVPRKILFTCPFLYIRWIGKHGAYDLHTHERILREEELRHWGKLLVDSVNEVEMSFGFFNNDYSGYAAGTALRFKTQIDLTDDWGKVEGQMRLF